MRVAREVRPPFFRCGISSAVFLFLYYQCVDFGPSGLTQRRKDAEKERRREARVPRSNEA